ncbi:MAG: RidA family protein [Verrucomicrobiota bacterium]
MRKSSLQNKLQELGLELPPPPASIGHYLPAVRSGQQLHLSGGISLSPEKSYLGKVGLDLDLSAAREAAVLCVLNRLSVIQAELGHLERVRQIVSVSGFVNSAPDFVDQPQVIDAASELLVELFGESGRHSRIAVGVNALPLNVAVEISMVVEVSD